ncbi:TIGR04222 domain-containing membrane protein [Kitasatospora sp. NPDC057738]|uniref:TIGR04222 domain-containing membrane protein n=1 Tax=Kitasatospora sp. NPDC057738 TaxID=3346233 RepID=UPI00338A60DF
MWHNSYFVVPAVLLAAAALYAARTRQHIGRVRYAKGLPGRGLPLLDTAFLSGGPGRVFDTAVVRMHMSEQVVISRSGLVTLTGSKPYDAVDKAVQDAVGPTGSRQLGSLRHTVMRSAAVQEIGDRLADRGLLRRPERLRRARTARRLLWLALLLVVASAVASLLLDDGTAGHDRPNLWVPGLLLFGGLTALLATAPVKGRITPAGQRQLSLMQGTPWKPNAGMPPRLAGGALLGALALGGLAAAGLDNPELEAAMLTASAEEEAVRQAVAANASSSSSSSSSSASSASSCSSGSSGSDGGSASWCGSSDSGSSGSGCGSSSCGSSSSSCGSSSSSCGSSSSSSCGSSSSSSCGSSCGGGCGGS